MSAIVHEPLTRSWRGKLCWPGLKPLTIVERPEDIDPLVRVANEAVLIEGDPSYAAGVLPDDHEFLFQID